MGAFRNRRNGFSLARDRAFCYIDTGNRKNLAEFFEKFYFSISTLFASRISSSPSRNALISK